MSEQLPYKVVIDYISKPILERLQNLNGTEFNIREYVHALNTLQQFILSLKEIDDIKNVRDKGNFSITLQETLMDLVIDVCFPLAYHLQSSAESGKTGQEKSRVFALVIHLILTCADYLEETKLVCMITQLFIPLFLHRKEHTIDSQVLKGKLCQYHTKMHEQLTELSSLEMINPFLGNQILFTKFLNCLEDKETWLYELFKILVNISAEETVFCKSFTVISKLFLYCPIPLRVKCEKEVWDTYTAATSNAVHWKSIYVFYCLKDFYFPVEESGKDKLSSNLCSNNFWCIIQLALLSEDPSHRKLSMYLIKRLVDTCGKHRCNLNIAANVQNSNDLEPLFWWSSSSTELLTTIWENFFLLIETLEEKQVHVIKPILPRMQKLVDACIATSSDGHHLLHCSWLITIFTRCFHHDSHFMSRWAAQTLLTLDFNRVPLIKHQQLKFLSHDLLMYLQENKLYSRYDGLELGMCSPVGEALKSFFHNLFSILTKPQKVDYIRNLLQIICDNSWGAIPLVFIFQGVSHISCEPFIGPDLLQLTRQVLHSCLACLEPVTRGAILCFISQSLLKLIDLSTSNWNGIFNTLAFISREECLQRGTNLWKSAVQWLQSNLVNSLGGTQQISALLTDYLQAKNEGENCSVIVDGYRVAGLGRMLMLLADAEAEEFSQLADGEVKKKLMQGPLGISLGEVCANLKDLHSRAYISTDKVNRSLSLVYHLIMEEGKVETQVDLVIWKYLECLFHEVSHFVLNKFQDELIRPGDIDDIEFYGDVLLCLGIKGQSILRDLLALLDHVSRVFSVSLKADITNQNLAICDLHSTSAMKLLAVTLDIVRNKTENFKLCPADVSKAISSLTLVFQVPLPFSRSRNRNESISKFQVGRLISFFISNKWKCQKYLLEHWLQHQDIVTFDLSPIVNYVMEDMGMGCGESDVEILQTVELILPQLFKMSVPASFAKMLTLCWSNALEEKKNVYFWRKLKAFMPILFHQTVLTAEEPLIQEAFNELTEKVLELSSDKTGVMYLVFDHLCGSTLKNDTDREIATKLIPLLVQGCYTGNINKKGERVWLDVCSYIESLGPQCSVNEITSSMSKNDLFTRIIVLNWLSSLRPESAADHKFVLSFLQSLKTKYLDLAALTTYKQFSNSLSHRQKHRMSLVFLLLVNFIAKETCEIFLPDLWQALELECHPSVRQNIEWLIVVLIIRYPAHVNDIWDIFLRFNDKRSVCLCSLFLIVSHLGPKLPGDIQNQYFRRALRTILPWSMAHHYNTRIFAQTALVRLWEHICILHLHSVQSEFAFMKEFVHFIFNNINASDTVQKLLNNYIYSSFDPVRDFSMETIFHTLPRLACLADEEGILPRHFIRIDKSWQVCNSDRQIQLYNSSHQLVSCKKGPWRTKAQAENEDDLVESADGDVQKKIMPWRQMSPDHETEAELDLHRHKHNGGLILVTSLIDKVPNLGGLCRTSEIFGVSEFVIGNLIHVEDRMFQNLSVSAQKWITITEVMKPKLSLYLEEKKLDGYTLVGVEQTANSVSLQDYKFPKKTLLLLGNEREGIPVEIIQSLDVCVEIPQQGVIRSLNVHVCGALIVWEYTRQHMQPSLTEATTPVPSG